MITDVEDTDNPMPESTTGMEQRKRRRKIDVSPGVRGKTKSSKQPATTPNRLKPSASGSTDEPLSSTPAVSESIEDPLTNIPDQCENSPRGLSKAATPQIFGDSTQDECVNGRCSSESSTTTQVADLQSQSTQTYLSLKAMKELVSQKDSSSENHELTKLMRERDDLLRLVAELKLELQKCNKQLEKSLNTNRTLILEKAMFDHEQARSKCNEEKIRLGQYVSQRQGTTFTDQWLHGFAFELIFRQQAVLNKAKEECEKERKMLVKKRPDSKTGKACTIRHNSSLNTQHSDTESSNDKPYEKTTGATEWYEQDEILKLRLNTLRKEEAELAADSDKLDRERHVHKKEMKRISNEDNSRFSLGETVIDRYIMLSLLGKGGFSEVHKAFDVKEQHYAACKVHQLNKDWCEEKKASYIRHALREYNIQKNLYHPRIVRLFDVFEIDKNSFCTVLEYCDGSDLDFYLKQHKTIPEKESRSIVVQIVNGLRYLNVCVKPPVIHYDLKPANIMIGVGEHSGEVKITDFGLSKQMNEECYDPDHGMDLTSQGAGTYWYLPPEVFVQGPMPPKISSKVDVWSVGCIFYQCLYGKKPFGHNLSQAAILERNTILKATEVQFLTKPPVSNDAKAFIRLCLTYHVKERPDIIQLSELEYLKPQGPRRSTAAAVAASNLQTATAAVTMPTVCSSDERRQQLPPAMMTFQHNWNLQNPRGQDENM